MGISYFPFLHSRTIASIIKWYQMKNSYVTDAINSQSSFNGLKSPPPLSCSHPSHPLSQFPLWLSFLLPTTPSLNSASLASVVFLELSPFRIFAPCCHWSRMPFPHLVFMTCSLTSFWSWLKCCLLRSLSLANVSKIAVPPTTHTLSLLSLPCLIFLLMASHHPSSILQSIIV